LKRYFEYFTQKTGLWLVTIMIMGLVAGLLFLDVLSARQMRSMIIETKGPLDGFYLWQSMARGALTAAVIILLAFLIANERARFQILEQQAKATTKGLERYAKRLKRSEEKYRSLVESADDIIYTMDKYCNIWSVNPRFTGLMGQYSTDLIGKAITDVVEYNTSADTPSIVDKILGESEILVQEERVEIGAKQYWLSTKYQAVGSGQDVPSLVLVISRDITDQKRIEQQLFHTEKLASLGALSAGVAHEINNPIAIILGFSELLLGKFPEGSKEHEMHKAIQRQVSNCKRIVENLLAFSRIPEQVTAETDAVQDLQRVFNLVTNTLMTRKIESKMAIEKNLPKVRGDGQHLEQVFLNIINNAVAAMDSGGILTVSAERSNDMVSIAFSDTGCGIPPQNMDKIFEPFFTTHEVGEGIGLGLSVSYGIVKMFGGDIHVKSETERDGKNPGTTVTVTLHVAHAGSKAKHA